MCMHAFLCMYAYHMTGAWEGQKRASNLSEITDSCEATCGLREQNLGPVKEQKVLLTTKLSFQTQKTLII